MAYKQKGCSPITAKLKRTTKGGMVQDPLLNVGSVAKMKGDLNKDGKMSGYETARQTAIDKSMSSPAKQGGRYNKRKRNVKKQDAAEFSKKRDSDIQKLTSETNAMQGAISSYESKSGGKAPKSDYNYLNKSKAKLKDRQASAAGEAAMLADSKARKNKTGLYAPKPKAEKRKKATVKAQPAKTAKIAKIEAKAPKAEIIASKPKVEKFSKAKTNKLTRAAGVRAKGEAALASGNVRKARRLKRREERIKKRAARK